MAHQENIRSVLAATGYSGKYRPHQIEAFMRLDRPTLDGLSPSQFRREVEIARRCIDASDPTEVEVVARSFGLVG